MFNTFILLLECSLLSNFQIKVLSHKGERLAEHSKLYHSTTSIELPKAGVILGGLVPSDKLTERMYDDQRWERFRKVMRAVDEINRRWGKDTVRFAAARSNGEWLGRCSRRSPRYTTRFAEVMKIR